MFRADKDFCLTLLDMFLQCTALVVGERERAERCISVITLVLNVVLFSADFHGTESWWTQLRVLR